ncbi:MAG: hypothetical protein V1742_00930 [Pseudomonadota bacterium]
MKLSSMILIIFLFLAASLMIFPTGCAWAGPGKGKGPPPQAPAHGYRAKQLYYYYPNANVYFEPVRKVYFFLSGGAWQISATLPVHLKVNLADMINLELDTDKPCIYNSEHKAKYPPGQLKKKDKDKPGK